MSKCKYYREYEGDSYTPSCTGDTNSMHPEDILGEYCQFCGDKIKFKEFTKVPWELED